MWVKYKNKRINLLQVRKYEPSIISDNKFYLIEIDETDELELVFNNKQKRDRALKLIDEFISCDGRYSIIHPDIKVYLLDLDKELE